MKAILMDDNGQASIGEIPVFDGAYNSLTGKPTIPAAQVAVDWNSVAGVNQVLNKPTIPTTTAQLTNTAGFLTDTYIVGATLTILSKTTNVNFKTTGTTDLYTVPAGKSCIITSIIIRATSGSGITVAAQGSVGTNASAYNNINITVGFTGLTASGKTYLIPIIGSTAVALTGEIIKGNITVGAIGTALICEVILVGFLY